MGKKGKGKKTTPAEEPGGGAAGDSQASGSQPQPAPATKPQQPAQQPPTQQPPTQQQHQGRGRGQPHQQPAGRGEPYQQPAGRGEPFQQQQQGRGGGRGRGQPYQQPAGRGEPYQQHEQQPGRGGGRGRGQPYQQPAGRGEPYQQQQQQQPGRGGGRGREQPYQQPAGRGEPYQQQQQQQPGRGGGRGREQPYQQPAGRGEPYQQQQQQAPAWSGGRGQPQQQAPAWGGRGQPQQQAPAWGGLRQPQHPQQQIPGGPGQRSATPSETSRGPAGSSREGTLSPTSSVGSVAQLQEPLQQLTTQPTAAPGAPQQQPSQQQPKQRSKQTVHHPPATAAPVAAAPAKSVAEELALAIPQSKQMRKGGTAGRPVYIETNHLPLDIKPKYETAIHYDVTIVPDKPKRLMRRVWEEFKRQYLGRSQVAFDDVKNAYSPERLPPPIGDEGGGEVSVAEDANSKPKTYKVVLKYAATVNLRTLSDYMRSGGTIEIPQEALQCIEIVLRNASATRFVKVGRSFFTPPQGRVIPLGDGLEMWHGFFQSAVIGWKPFLNVDVAHKGFPKEQRVVDAILEIARAERVSDIQFDFRFRDTVKKFLKGLKIEYELPRQPSSRRSYRVNDLVETPDNAKFVMQDGKQITVLNYFQNEKQYRLQYVNIPCLWVGPRDRKIYLPAELCKIMPNQVINKKLNEIQTSNMVRNAATSTAVRKDKIMQSLNLANFNNDPCVRAFGLNVGNQFENIKARVLDPPKLEYGNNATVMPFKGVWRTPGIFLKPGAVNSWSVFNLTRNIRDEKVDDFVKMFSNEARKQGLNMGAVIRPYLQFDVRDIQKYFETAKKKGCGLVFVIIPDYPADTYSRVKRAAELAVGILTQCIKSKTMFKMSPPTVCNILLKVNAKLNGLNHQILRRPKCLERPCMIMGADVTHPSPDQTDIPSVAAVTASCDATASFKYNFLWRLQPAKKEIITDLENIVVEQLKYFYQFTGQRPERIIFFRDGVSEGQFKEVMNAEVQAIRRACARMGNGSYKPPITFLVVQKRHHTRFFPTDPRDSDDRNVNVRAGTIVDTVITHPTYTEYYLVSHASIQGVARPTKYRMLWDDMNMSEDEIQQLTYYLCHMFSRCTRSVSYPAPTYYAHLAAFRVRNYLEGQQINLENLDREAQMRQIKEEIFKGHTMFFV